MDSSRLPDRIALKGDGVFVSGGAALDHMRRVAVLVCRMTVGVGLKP